MVLLKCLYVASCFPDDQKDGGDFDDDDKYGDDDDQDSGGGRVGEFVGG